MSKKISSTNINKNTLTILTEKLCDFLYVVYCLSDYSASIFTNYNVYKNTYWKKFVKYYTVIVIILVNKLFKNILKTDLKKYCEYLKIRKY